MKVSVQVLITDDKGRFVTAAFTREFKPEDGRAHLTAEEVDKLVSRLSHDATDSAALLAGLEPLHG